MAEVQQLPQVVVAESRLPDTKPRRRARGVRAGQRHRATKAVKAITSAKPTVVESQASKLVRIDATALVEERLHKQQCMFELELEAAVRAMTEEFDGQAAELGAKLAVATDKLPHLEAARDGLEIELRRLSTDFARSSASTAAPSPVQSPWQATPGHEETTPLCGLPPFPNWGGAPPPLSPASWTDFLSHDSLLSPSVSPWPLADGPPDSRIIDMEASAGPPPGLKAPPGLPTPASPGMAPCSPAPPGLSLPTSPRSRGPSRSSTPMASPVSDQWIAARSPSFSPLASMHTEPRISPGVSPGSRRGSRSGLKSPFADRQAFSLMSSPSMNFRTSPKPHVILEEGGEIFSFMHRRNSKDMDWGLEFSHCMEDTGLSIENVREGGAMAAWNKQCAGGPTAGKAVTKGDVIVNVNGAASCDDMIAEFRSNLLLKLTVRRGQTEDDFELFEFGMPGTPWVEPQALAPLATGAALGFN